MRRRYFNCRHGHHVDFQFISKPSQPPPPCGTFAQPDGSVLWRVWAPHARAVELVLFDGDGKRTDFHMQPEVMGYFTLQKRSVGEGQRYAFRLDGGPDRPDPCSRWQPDGIHRPSAVFFPDRFQWDERGWAGIRREELVIYELHVGTFTAQGAFDAVVDRLPDLKELGITAIELMPVHQFPGERNWGYDGVHLFAPQNSYGGPHGLQRLVGAAHAAGLAVILDVVYNHVGPEGNYLGEFGPYLARGHATPWGSAFNFDESGSDAVREFVLANVRQWIGDYRVDGLRLDAVHAMVDSSPRHILSEIKAAADDEARRLGRPVHVIAESNLNDVRLLDPPDRGGYGLDAQWNDDFHYALHAVLTGEREGHYVDFGDVRHLVKALNQTFVLDGGYSHYRGRRHGAPAGNHPGDRFVISIQTHDHVGNRRAGDRYGTILSPAQQRLAAGLLLLAPYVPLLFMGQEYGETHPFHFFCSYLDPQFADAVRRGRRQRFQAAQWRGELPDPQAQATFLDSKLGWSWPADSWQAGLRRLYQALLTARRRWPGLNDFHTRSAELLPHMGQAVVRLDRGDRRGDRLTIYFNLSEHRVELGRDQASGVAPLLCSESTIYGGSRTADDRRLVLLPWEFVVLGVG